MYRALPLQGHKVIAQGNALGSSANKYSELGKGETISFHPQKNRETSFVVPFQG